MTDLLIDDKDYLWKSEQENILKKWGDKATCYKMMHERAYRKYWAMNAWFNIPIIIISTITGTGNFASSNFGSNALLFTYIIGGFSIFAGILATISTYIGAAQRLEGHHFAAIHWDKFTRKVQIELAKPRVDRIKAKTFMKMITDEYDRLIEMSPILPNDIVRWFTEMIDNNEHIDDSECKTCLYECFCFPCGCKICLCNLPECCNCTHKKNHSNTRTDWSKIELPEIIGRVKETHIAPENNDQLIEVKNDTYTIYRT